MGVTGTAIKYGDNIDTDAIIAARYLVTGDPKELAAHCMEDIDAGFAARVRPGDVIVGGANFGCGSSREHAPLAIKGSDVSCVIAASFARIFYRNSINIGLPILECPEAAADIDSGDMIKVDFAGGVIENETKNKRYTAVKFPPFIDGIIESGGLLSYLAKRSEKI